MKINHDKHPKYFAYGSNLSPKWINERCPSAIVLDIALLRGYELQFRYPSNLWPGKAAADIVPKTRGEVWGVLYSLSHDDIKTLDKHEDVDLDGYRRIEVVLETKTSIVKAYAYEVINKLEHELAPSHSYVDLVLKGALHHGLPEHYISFVQSKINILQNKLVPELV